MKKTTKNPAAQTKATTKATKSTTVKSLPKKASSKTSKVIKTQKTPKEKAIADTKKQQKPSIIEEVISHREVKYKYPADVVDTLARKTWRQKVRNKLRALERETFRIKDQNSKEFLAAKAALEKYQSQVLKIEEAV